MTPTAASVPSGTHHVAGAQWVGSKDGRGTHWATSLLVLMAIPILQMETEAQRSGDFPEATDRESHSRL